METFTYKINDTSFDFPTKNPPDFQLGTNQVISNHKTDITVGQPWYEEGYNTQAILDSKNFNLLKQRLTDRIKGIIDEALNIDTANFCLERYHKYVRSEQDHFAVFSKTRDLYLTDLDIDLIELFEQFKNSLGFELTDIDPHTHSPIYVIVRINRPGSNDFNPPHKDVYHFIDEDAYIPQFLNIWIPICGVSEKSSLPVVKSSHLIPESKILRTVDRGAIGKNTYNVRMVKTWDGSNKLTRIQMKYGEALYFSSHLIHGLALNEEKDTTRISLEFRLFKK